MINAEEHVLGAPNKEIFVRINQKTEVITEDFQIVGHLENWYSKKYELDWEVAFGGKLLSRTTPMKNIASTLNDPICLLHIAEVPNNPNKAFFTERGFSWGLIESKHQLDEYIDPILEKEVFEVQPIHETVLTLLSKNSDMNCSGACKIFLSLLILFAVDPNPENMKVKCDETISCTAHKISADIVLYGVQNKPILIVSVLPKAADSVMSHFDLLRTTGLKLAGITEETENVILGLVTNLSYWCFTSYVTPKKNEILTIDHMKISRCFHFPASGEITKDTLQSLLCLIKGFILNRAKLLKTTTTKM
jgi:hypothetical protein